MDKRHRVLSIIGTRPEAIKMAPVIQALDRRAAVFESIVVATGQHREMLDPVLKSFAIKPDVDLDLMQRGHGISEFAAKALAALSDLFVRARPDIVLVQGDTTTVLCAALVSFWLGLPLGHVEAGLRSHDRQQPFPEEFNREVAGLAAEFHFAPTGLARENLLRAGVSDQRIFLTGNTVVDALQTLDLSGPFSNDALNSVDFGQQRVILLTVHRRENHGEPLIGICRAVRALVDRVEDTHVILPVHLNPSVRTVVLRELGGAPRVTLTDPLEYHDLLRVMARCHLVMTDSGGIQEEAPSFQRPVLVLREVTERPEAVEAGLAALVGTEEERVLEEAFALLTDEKLYRSMTQGQNPFGDGHAGERIASVLEGHVALAGGSADPFAQAAAEGSWQ